MNQQPAQVLDKLLKDSGSQPASVPGGPDFTEVDRDVASSLDLENRHAHSFHPAAAGLGSRFSMSGPSRSAFGLAGSRWAASR